MLTLVYFVHGCLCGLVETEFIIRVIVEVDATTLPGSAIAGKGFENLIFVVVFVRLGIIDTSLGLARWTRKACIFRIWRLYQPRQL
jgi:hypothetical protein